MNNTGAIRYLSLAVKAGGVIFGAEECEKAVRRGKGGLLILAADAAQNAVKRAGELAAHPRVQLMKTIYTKAELAAALGRGSAVAVVLVTNENLAKAFTAASNPTEQEERI